MRYALIDNNSICQNIIEYDGRSPYSEPEGWTILLLEDAPVGAAIGLELANGAWIAPAPPTPEVPASIAMWQAKAALQNAGLLAQANAAISALNNEVLALFWTTATSIARNSPTLAQIATALNLPSEQVDELFIAAAAISL